MIRFLVFFFCFTNFLFAQKGYPTPAKTNNLLFYVQHSDNKNTFVYEFNSSNASDPVDVFRINYEDKGQKEVLTPIQRRFAYGVNYTNSTKTQFNLAATKQNSFNLKSANGKYWVELSVRNQIIKVDRIFIVLDSSTSGINVKADYILVYGKNKQNKSVVEKIKP